MKGTFTCKIAFAAFFFIIAGVSLSVFRDHVTAKEGKGAGTQARTGCLSSDSDLEGVLENGTHSSSARVILASTFNNALIAKPCAAFIIEGVLTGTNALDEYVKYFKEGKGDIPLIFVDDIREWTRQMRIKPVVSGIKEKGAGRLS